MPLLSVNLNKNFNLDSSGIAGFFGGEEAIAAMNSVHLIPHRRWMGWYNSPGSYAVAKKYGILPDSTFWDGLFPGPSREPEELLELNTQQGPRYTGVYSGTQLPQSNHLSYLIAKHCKNRIRGEVGLPDGSIASPTNAPSTPLLNKNAQGDKPQHRRISVTVMDFADIDRRRHGGKVDEKYFKSLPIHGIIGIIFTVTFSMAASVLSALFDDWYSFSMILYGAIANGITLLVLGSGELHLSLTQPAAKSPPGDGIMWDTKNIVIVQGSERVISTVLHSQFRLQYPNDENYYKIGFCCISLLAQFLLQLFLIPQGILIGQVLFLCSLAASWICNGYLASFDREMLQTDLLFNIIGPRQPVCYKFEIDKWSVAVAFTMAYFDWTDAEPKDILNELIPNSTPAWNLWKMGVCLAIRNQLSLTDLLPGGKAPSTELCANYQALSEKDRDFIRSFLKQTDRALDLDKMDAFKSMLKKKIAQAPTDVVQESVSETERRPLWLTKLIKIFSRGSGSSGDQQHALATLNHTGNLV